MANSVALVNKDIARHYQLSNLLAPPEAIELTKLYNEMSNILSKPVKFRDKPMQLHLFYDLLSQYATHLNNLKMDGNQPLPSIPEPAIPQTVETKPDEKSQTLHNETMEDDDAFADANATMIGPQSSPPKAASTPKQSKESTALVPFTPRPTQPLKTPKQGTPMTEMSKFLKNMTRNIETPKKVFNLLIKNDPTFQWNSADNSLVLKGHVFHGEDFIKTLEALRNPDMKPQDQTSQVIVKQLTQILQNEDIHVQNKFHSKLPGLRNFIIKQPLTTRHGASKKLDLDSTAVTSTNVHEPKIIVKDKKGKGRRLTKSKPSPLKVHWKRWQTKIRYFIIQNQKLNFDKTSKRIACPLNINYFYIHFQIQITWNR